MALQKKVIDTTSKNKVILAAYLALAAIGLVFPVAFIILFALFPAAFLVKAKSKSAILLSAPLILLLNVALLITATVLMAFVNIPINEISLVLSNIAFTLASLFIGSKHLLVMPQLKPTQLKVALFIYVLFILTFIVRVVSVIKLPVPILHDPIAHAFYAKSIVSSADITYWYSPGLHIVTGFVEMFTGLDFARSTHIVTNIFNALSVLTFGIFAYLITKKISLAAITSSLMVVASSPAFAYTAAGKNAMVMAVAIIPVVIYFFVSCLSERKLAHLVYFALLSSALGLIHTPTFLVVFLGLGTALLIWLAAELLSGKFQIKNAAAIIAPFAIVGLILGAWGYSNYSDLQLEKENNYSAAGAERENNSAQRGPIGKLVHNISASTDKLESAWGSPDFEPYDTYKGFYLPVFIVSVLYCSFVFVSKNERTRAYNISLVSLGISMLAIIFMIPTLGLTGLNIVSSTAVILFPVITALIAAFVIFDISTRYKFGGARTYTLLAILLAVIGLSLVRQYEQYRDFSKTVNTVSNTDLAAFDWINSNVEDGFGIVSTAAIGSRKNVVYAGGGGAWIPVFTDNAVSMPFQNGLFKSKQTHENYNNYLALRDSQSSEAADHFLSNNFKYLYHDKEGWLVDQLAYQSIENNKHLTKVYENEGVAIFEIKN